MVGDLLFRAFYSVLWVVFLAIFSWVAHSTKWSAGRRTTRHANRLRAVALAFAGLYFAAVLFYALVPSWVVIFSIPLPEAFRTVMVVAVVLGMCFIVWALRSLGKNWAPSLSGVRKDTFLVTTGGSVHLPLRPSISIRKSLDTGAHLHSRSPALRAVTRRGEHADR